MSKAPASIKNFLNSSNVEVRRAAPTRQAFPQRFEKKIVNNENLGEFAEFLNMSNSDNNNNDVEHNSRDKRTESHIEWFKSGYV